MHWKTKKQLTLKLRPLAPPSFFASLAPSVLFREGPSVLRRLRPLALSLKVPFVSPPPIDSSIDILPEESVSGCARLQLTNELQLKKARKDTHFFLQRTEKRQAA